MQKLFLLFQEGILKTLFLEFYCGSPFRRNFGRTMENINSPVG